MKKRTMGLSARIRNWCSRKKTKWLLKHCEHTFEYHGVKVRYLFAPKKKSKRLVIVFSGMNAQRASYSYINLLNDLPHNRLYILDDYGHDILGCYYLGTKGQNQAECAVNALIESLCKKYTFERRIYCGSSKGGYAALNFGLNASDAVIIAGAPQYRLGYYLSHRKSPELMGVISGESRDDPYLEVLDERLGRRIAENAHTFSGKIYLHYSTEEHTYAEHIRFLRNDLKSHGYLLDEDICTYPTHDEVSVHFPPYLTDVLSKQE